MFIITQSNYIPKAKTIQQSPLELSFLKVTNYKTHSSSKQAGRGPKITPFTPSPNSYPPLKNYEPGTSGKFRRKL